MRCWSIATATWIFLTSPMISRASWPGGGCRDRAHRHHLDSGEAPRRAPCDRRAVSNVYCSVGTHPHHADEEDGVPADELIGLTRHPKVVALGEAGLDYFYQHGSPKPRSAAFARTSPPPARPACRWSFTPATPTTTAAASSKMR